MNFVILTHNNEKVFTLLDSLAGQRVWIVDDESSADYVQRMKAHFVKPIVYRRRLLMDFSTQRNFIAQHIPPSEWICMLDSDEFLSFDPADLVATVAAGSYQSISFDRYNFVTGEGEIPAYPAVEQKVRGYRNLPENRWKNSVHEEAPFRVADLHYPGWLLHEKTNECWRDQRDFYRLFGQRFLLSYAVSASVRDDFIRAQSFQDKLPPNFTKLVIANQWLDLKGCEQLVDARIGDGPTFNLSKQRNLAIQYAIDYGYDWLLILDADLVILDAKEMPANGYGTGWGWKQNEGEPLSAADWNDQSRWTYETSWFMLSRDLFIKNWCRFDEAYEGAFHQDWDFHEHVLSRNGIERTSSLVKMAHLWHPVRGIGLPENAERFERKRQEYQAARAMGLTIE